jgi:hypothetical protein
VTTGGVILAGGDWCWAVGAKESGPGPAPGDRRWGSPTPTYTILPPHVPLLTPSHLRTSLSTLLSLPYHSLKLRVPGPASIPVAPLPSSNQLCTILVAAASGHPAAPLQAVLHLGVVHAPPPANGHNGAPAPAAGAAPWVTPLVYRLNY